MFNVQSGKYTVTVTFSEEGSAPGLEESLVKILTKRVG